MRKRVCLSIICLLIFSGSLVCAESNIPNLVGKWKVLAEGGVQLYKTASDGREIVIKTLRAGEIFGEVVLFEQKEYPVSAVALEKSLLLRLPRKQIDCLLVADSLVALLSLILALLFLSGEVQVWQVFVLMFFRSIGGGFH